jgi:hypothetical protein
MKRKPVIEGLSIFVALILVILPSGCATSGMRMYTGEALPKEQVAVIKGSTKFLYLGLAYVVTGARILEADGKALLHPTKTCEVLPGLHSLVVEPYRWLDVLFLPNPGGETCGWVFLKFNTEAGHQYKIEVPYWWKRGTLVNVIDTKSGEIVATQSID